MKEERKNIWIVTELFYPEETAVAYIFTRIANYLSDYYWVRVISGPEFYDHDKKKFNDKISLSPAIKIFRVRSLRLDKNSLSQRSVKIALNSIKMFLLMLKNIRSGDIVLLSTNPAMLLLLMRPLKLIKKIQLHILVHDVFPENTIPARIIKRSDSLSFRFLKALFDRSYACADHLIVIGRDMQEIMVLKVSRFKLRPVISIVTNWSGPLRKIEPGTSRQEAKKIVIGYSGNLGRVQGLMEILEAFRLCNNENVILKFRGSGALYNDIENFKQEHLLDNVKLGGPYSREDESEILAGCDIGLVCLAEGMYGLGVPSKTYQLLASGKPILYIGVPDTEISKLVEEYDIGWSLDIRNRDTLIAFFHSISDFEFEKIRIMGIKARKLAETSYSEASILKLLKEKIEFIAIAD